MIRVFLILLFISLPIVGSTEACLLGLLAQKFRVSLPIYFNTLYVCFLYYLSTDAICVHGKWSYSSAFPTQPNIYRQFLHLIPYFVCDNSGASGMRNVMG
jgi:hypothetical protein